MIFYATFLNTSSLTDTLPELKSTKGSSKEVNDRSNKSSTYAPRAMALRREDQVRSASSNKLTIVVTDVAPALRSLDCTCRRRCVKPRSRRNVSCPNAGNSSDVLVVAVRSADRSDGV